MAVTEKAKRAPTDAIEMLKADHKAVKALFKQFAALKDDNDVDNDAEKSDVVRQICDALVVHTTIEEEVFYPAVREAIDDGDLMDEALVEHAGAKDLIEQLKEMDPADDLFDAKVTVLGEQIDHHVEEEEQEMFPKAKKAKLDTQELGSEMSIRREELEGKLEAAAAKAPNRKSKSKPPEARR